MKIYTYCIVDSNGKIGEPIKGLKDIPVYNIPYRDIGIVASDIDGQISGPARECALVHEWVAERLMERYTVLPIRLLTIFKKREDLLFMMEDRYTEFRENLDRLRDKVEFGIKVIWPAEAIRGRIVEVRSRVDTRAVLAGDSPGKRFLKDRLEKFEVEEEFEQEAEKCIAAVDGFFGGFAVEKRLEKLKTGNLLLNGSYLVEKARQDDFRGAFERLKKAKGDLKYLLSGPWPPYNFVTLTRNL